MGQLQERYKNYREPQKYMAAGVYPYFRAITSKQGPEVEMDGHKVLMFGSNAYTGLTGDERVIEAAHKALDKYNVKATFFVTNTHPDYQNMIAEEAKSRPSASKLLQA